MYASELLSWLYTYMYVVVSGNYANMDAPLGKATAINSHTVEQD